MAGHADAEHDNAAEPLMAIDVLLNADDDAEQILIRATARGIEKLIGVFESLAAVGAEVVLTDLPYVRTDGVRELLLRCCEPPPDTGWKKLADAIRPSETRGLRRTSSPPDPPAYTWNLDESYWSEFIEKLTPLLESPQSGDSCDLFSLHYDDAAVSVEYRNAL